MKKKEKQRSRKLKHTAFTLVNLLIDECGMTYDTIKKETGIPRSTSYRIASGEVENVNEEYYRILHNLCLDRELI